MKNYDNSLIFWGDTTYFNPPVGMEVNSQSTLATTGRLG